MEAIYRAKKGMSMRFTTSAFRAILLILAAFGVFSEAQAEEFAKVSIAPRSRVGVVSLVGSELANMHFGFMAFTTFSERIANDWNLDAAAVGHTKALLATNGYEVVDVRIEPALEAQLQKQEDWSRLNYTGLDRNFYETYRRLLAENRLSALVVLREEQLRAGERIEYHGFGIVSAQFAALFTSVVADVIGGDPPHRSIEQCRAQQMFDKDMIAEYRDLKPAAVEWIRPLLQSLIEKKIEFELSSSGLLATKAVCPKPAPLRQPKK